MGCSLSVFYIKPQHILKLFYTFASCSLSVFYIKPQLYAIYDVVCSVVPYQYSTSNRNRSPRYASKLLLFLISILHQTATTTLSTLTVPVLFLISILHQTATISRSSFTWTKLFLISILHQTATSSCTTSCPHMLFLISILHQTATSNSVIAI